MANEHTSRNSDSLMLTLFVTGLLLAVLVGYLFGMTQKSFVPPPGSMTQPLALTYNLPAGPMPEIAKVWPESQPLETHEQAGGEGWRNLISGNAMTGWDVTRGDFRVENGVLFSTQSERGARVETTDSFKDFELTAQVQVDKGRYAELHLHGYGQVFPMEFPDMGVWRELKVTSRGQEIAVTLGGDRLKIDRGDGDPKKEQGNIGFYVGKGSVLKLKDIRVRPL